MATQSQHSSLTQTMAQMRRRYNTRSSGGSDTPYNGYDPSPHEWNAAGSRSTRGSVCGFGDDG